MNKFILFFLVLICFLALTPVVKAQTSSLKYFGYFFPSIYVEETTSFANLAFAYSSPTDGTSIERNAMAGQMSLVDIHSELFVSNGLAAPNTKYVLKQNWQESWHSWWNNNKRYAGNIAAWYILDEPDANTYFGDYQKATAEVKSTMTAEGFDIPIYMAVTGRAPRLIIHPDEYNPTSSYYNIIDVSWMKNGKFNIPSEVGWVGFDQYNCWDDCGQPYIHLSTTTKYSIPQMETALLAEGRKVNPFMKIAVIPGVLGIKSPTDTVYQALVIDLAQKYYDYCSGNSNCVAIINFLYSYRPPQRALGYLGSRDYPDVLAKQKVLGKLVLAANQTVKIPGDLTDLGDTSTDEVNKNDYTMISTYFGKTGPSGWITADISKNGKIDIFDYNIMVGNYTK